LRALGHGMRAAVDQFMKGREDTGEVKFRHENYSIKQFGRSGFLDKTNPKQEDKELAKKGLEYAEKVLDEKQDILILDELNLTIYYDLLTIHEIISLLDSAKQKMQTGDIFLTGRYAPKELIDYADFATEMKEIKRPSKFEARKGIEF